MTDTRNSKVVDIINRLKEYGIVPIVFDPEDEATEANHEYKINLVDVKDVDCLVLAVGLDVFGKISWEEVESLFGNFENNEEVLIDVKSILDRM